MEKQLDCFFLIITSQKFKFFTKFFLVYLVYKDLLTFTKEILNGKLHFWRSGCEIDSHITLIYSFSGSDELFALYDSLVLGFFMLLSNTLKMLEKPPFVRC